MKIKYFILFQLILCSTSIFSQKPPVKNYNAGFMTVVLKDTTRVYKPKASKTDKLYYRPVELDIWYPSEEKIGLPINFEELFKLFEKRAIAYQDKEDYYSGLTEELAQFYVAEATGRDNGKELLAINTESFSEVKPSETKFPVIVYMSGFNGMGFENYKVLEKLAQKGFIVVSIWSVGRYPGDMTNEKEDMLEQVYDAEYALIYLKESESFNINIKNVGVLGYSWGGLGAVVLANRNKNIKAVVSYDGSETHFFGENKTENIYANGATEEDNDRFIREIQDSNYMNPQDQKFSYLYFESGNTLDFKVSSEYNYFKKINSEKYYLRFLNGSHADFSCIPSILKASEKSVTIYKNLEVATLEFFNSNLKGKESFLSTWDKLISQSDVTTSPIDVFKSETPKSTIEIKGKVYDSKTNLPLPYVNIIFSNKNTGTVTDDYGKFQLEINKIDEKDSVVEVSMIGYKSKKITVKQLEKTNFELNIALEQEVNQLEEVVITAPRKMKKRILGNKTKSRFIGHVFYSGHLGKEMGIKMNIKKSPTYIDEFNFHVSYNRFIAKTFFRLNIYTIEKGQPKDNILKENIIIPVEAGQIGDISVNLKEYDIQVSSDILVALEWVGIDEEIRNTDALVISLGVLTGGTYERETIQDKMKKKLRAMGLGFTLKVRQ